MSSFTEATFEDSGLTVGTRKFYRIKGRDGNGFFYHIGYVGSGVTVHVPEGFLTDGPSAPPLLRWLLPVGKMVKASAVHDMLREDERYTLIECDAVFLMAMQAEGTPALWREAAFAAVRTNSSRTKHNGIVK